MKTPPAWRYPDSCPVTYGQLLPALREVPVQELPGQPPCRPTRSKVAVASVGAAVPDALVICWLSCCADAGEVTNSPACTAGASPGRVTVTPGGIPLWVSAVLPGGTHDITAAREHVLAILQPCLKDLPVLADSGYEGAGCGIHVPVRKPPGGRELDLDTRSRNALLRSLRCLGERGFALMSQRWRTLQRVMLSPGKIGDIAQAALVLVQFEHKMIT